MHLGPGRQQARRFEDRLDDQPFHVAAQPGQALGVVGYCLLAAALNIRVSFITLGWVRSLITLLQMLPISLAGLGVREASSVWVLGKYGVPEAQALGLGLTQFALLVCICMLGGLFELWDLVEARRERSEQPPVTSG